LRWFGVGEGDEVIIPGYTYSATGNVVLHTGAKPVLVDIEPGDFNISLNNIKKAVTAKTKVIMPVDVGGWPVHYLGLKRLVESDELKKMFRPNSENQKKLGRMMILSDSAHSFGAVYHDQRVGCQVDAHVFSFHAVKNLTTAEGGAVTLNFPPPFDNDEIYRYLCVISLHGQTKDALSKTQPGAWRYDIVEPGYKCNMMDLQAAIGLVELERYKETLQRRKEICERYNKAFALKKWAITPIFKEVDRESSYHLYMLRIEGASESQRDEIIKLIAQKEVAVNVHFIPLAMLTAYKTRGYDIGNYPVTYDHYSNEISLPVYYDLTNEQVETVVNAVVEATEKVLS